MRCLLSLALGVIATWSTAWAESGRPIKILFLGDDGHHRPVERFRQLQPVLAARGIDLTYTDKLAALNPTTLAGYEGLCIYANAVSISSEQESALVDFVEQGKGLIALHCASYCFLNSPRYVELVGGQFEKHGTGIFRTIIADVQHPVMMGYGGFESWDETYVHTRHNPRNRTVLEIRLEGDAREPWTWVRTQGKGRVFYTAWGHDERTWSHPGFQNLVERGIRWAVGHDPRSVPPFVDRPEMTPRRSDVRPFEYVEANVPFYPAGQQWGRTADPIKRMQKPLAAAESIKHLVTPVQFEVRLFVSDPDLDGKPLCMNWDERGRLWIALSKDYPNELQPEGQGRDHILICEDVDGDGRADKFTRFADKLSLPTSLTFSHGGVIIHQPPHTLFLKDTDGDDRADQRRILFTGWSTGDTHAGPSNLQYGLDNWLYGIVGYAGYAGTVGGEHHSFRQGFYRFRPDGSRMEFLRSTNNNSWGLGFSEEGLLFGSTANGNPSIFMPIPNRYFERVRGWSAGVLPGIAGNAPMHPVTEMVRQVDWHGHFTAAAGHALYTARNYPPEYWNRTAFVTEPTGHLVATFQIQEDGSGFRSRNAWNLLASHDEWTAPTMAEVGPDGNVWVIDWYNYIVQHNPTPPGYKTGKGNAYEINLRDRSLARVYRVVPRGERPAKPISLGRATPDELVEALKHDNFFWRRHAQRLLVERGQRDIVPQLLKLLEDPSRDAIGLNPGCIHALWTLHGLGLLDGTNAAAQAAATSALRHASAGVRLNAVQVLPVGASSASAIVQAGLLRDRDPHVRLATLLAMADMPSSSTVAEAVLALLEQETNLLDGLMVEAATCAAAAHAGEFLQALGGKNLETSSHPVMVGLVERVAEHHARGAPVTSIAALLDSIARAPRTLSGGAIRGLARGWPKDKLPTSHDSLEKALVGLFTKLPPADQGHVLLLAARWDCKALAKHSAEVVRSLMSQIRDESGQPSARINAAQQLIEFSKQDGTVAVALLDQINHRTPPEMAQGLLQSLSRSEAPSVGGQLVNRFGSLSPAMRPVAIRTLLARADWTEALLDGLEAQKLAVNDLSLEQRQTLANHPNKAVKSRANKLLARGGGLPTPDRQRVVEELMPLTQQKGNAEAGKIVFKNHCAKCHTHSGEGAKIGPDLTGMAVHSKVELLTTIIDPSRDVEGNYRQYTILTTSGQLMSGLLVSESKTAFELMDVEAKKHVIQRVDIEEMKLLQKSLMPDGFEKQVTQEELRNLLEFLTQRGKYLSLPLGKVATTVSTRGMFTNEAAEVERLIFNDWSPKTFQGVPFYLVDPLGSQIPNAVLLYGPQGKFPPSMPRSVALPCNAPARAVHLLSGVSGWGHPFGERGSVSLIVRLHYDDGMVEDHQLRNGVHFADYIRRVDVPESQFAYQLRGQQLRYLAVVPRREQLIKQIEFVKGPDATAPVIMAVTVETR